MKYTSTAFALAAFALPVAYAQESSSGSAVVVNMCNDPVYIWSVGDEQSPMIALPNQTVGYQEAYRSKADKSGISIKIAPTYLPGDNLDTSQNVTQFEYTFEPETSTTWYDISYVNGNAFQGTPVLLQPSDLSCPNVTCAAGDSVCQEMYNNPNDNLATHACGSSSDLFFLLCPPNQDGSSSSSSSSSSGSSDKASVNTETSSGNTNGAEALTVDASGNVQLAPVSASTSSSVQTSDKDISSNAIGALTSIDAFSNVVTDWKTFSQSSSTKREELSARHSHLQHHQQARRSRIFRHSH